MIVQFCSWVLPHDLDDKDDPFQARCIINNKRILGQAFEDNPPPVTLHVLLLLFAAAASPGMVCPVSQKDTLWEGGEYRFTMEFCEDYPSKVECIVCVERDGNCGKKLLVHRLVPWPAWLRYPPLAVYLA